MYANQERVDECIEICNECRDECERMLFQHCAEQGGAHVEPGHMRIMADCAEICGVSARFMLRGSAMHAEICATCAEICDACAASCDEFDDDKMRQCANTCRRCADICREMGSQARGRGLRDDIGEGAVLM